MYTSWIDSFNYHSVLFNVQTTAIKSCIAFIFIILTCSPSIYFPSTIPTKLRANIAFTAAVLLIRVLINILKHICSLRRLFFNSSFVLNLMSVCAYLTLGNKERHTRWDLVNRVDVLKQESKYLTKHLLKDNIIKKVYWNCLYLWNDCSLLVFDSISCSSSANFKKGHIVFSSVFCSLLQGRENKLY